MHAFARMMVLPVISEPSAGSSTPSVAARPPSKPSSPSRFARIADVAGGHGHLLRAVLDDVPAAGPLRIVGVAAV
jgi:hypothetical protein